MNPLSTLAGFLAGLFGREVWEWLPAMTRALLRFITLPLPPERRGIRRKEWGADLHDFGQRRLAALVWVAGLLPACLWESLATRDAASRVTSQLEGVLAILALYLLMGYIPMLVALSICGENKVPLSETVLLVALSPVAAYGALSLLVPPGVFVLLILLTLCHLPFRLWRRLVPARQEIFPGNG